METTTLTQQKENTKNITKTSLARKHVTGAFQGGVLNRVAQFRDKVEALSKPAPEWTVSAEDPLYARPATGGRKVRHHNFNHDVNDAVEEVKYLCNVIRECGEKNPTDGSVQITFGQLFNLYVNISSKLVGTLLRARKYNYVTFKGELLLQNRDEDVVIKLINPN
ncbi:unnamed protein product [Rotaria sordida]|uniref:Costars domain-containing protein n=1 Tax=Rotaria sordida TaxID=392033 RepID=A0A819K799_9BILA|nr:unnamed protein product [Rotaria sordida]CAF3941017.1 unnamed protein product [Rotaria sordida]